MSKETQYFTVGFIFTPDLTKVLLVHKTKPAWQAGMLNGIGGKQEEHESMLTCILRETREESGLQTANWQHVGTLSHKEKRIAVLTTTYAGDTADAKQCDYEQVEWFSLDKIPDNTISDAKWLIVMAKEILQGNNVSFNTDCETENNTISFRV